MTYSQPQQSQYRPNRTALWVNDRKSAANQPDYKGNLELSYALVQELLAAFNAGQYTQDRGGQPCIKLDIALYGQQVTPGDKKPVLSGQLSTLADTQRGAAARQQAAQQYGQGQAPTPMPQQMPQQPQYAQPQPQQQPQPAPAPPQPAPGQLYGSQPQYGHPQPMQPSPQQPQAPEGWAGLVWSALAGAAPQQPQAPEGWPAHVPVPAGFAAPQQPAPQPPFPPQQPYRHDQPTPVAPPAPAQPIPGAIHGQPPAPVLPANF